MRRDKLAQKCGICCWKSSGLTVLSPASSASSSSLTSQSLGNTTHFLLSFWDFYFRKQLLMADALCRPRNFLQGWNWPGIFYRDEILEHDGKQGLVCPLWIRGHQCPQALYGDFSLCSSQDVSPHPYKATLELGLCLPLSPACGLVSPRRGHTAPRWELEEDVGLGPLERGTHIFGRVHGDDLQHFFVGWDWW